MSRWRYRKAGSKKKLFFLPFPCLSNKEKRRNNDKKEKQLSTEKKKIGSQNRKELLYARWWKASNQAWRNESKQRLLSFSNKEEPPRKRKLWKAGELWLDIMCVCVGTCCSDSKSSLLLYRKWCLFLSCWAFYLHSSLVNVIMMRKKKSL